MNVNGITNKNDNKNNKIKTAITIYKSHLRACAELERPSKNYEKKITHKNI